MVRGRAQLHVGSRCFELGGRAAPAAAGRAVRFDGPLDALLWLRRASTDPAGRAALRRFHADEAGAAGTAWLEVDDVLRQLAVILASGRASVVEVPPAVLGTLGGTAENAGDGAEEDPGEPSTAEAEPGPIRERSWITIELVGEDDEPIPGHRYRIELPDGSMREGVLDGRGLARLRDIDPGQCVVTFPDLDQDAWVPLGATGEP